MLERKWLGDKTKGGFYKKVKSGRRRDDERMALDWKTLEYHPRQKPKFAALDMAKEVDDTGARLRMLLGLDGGAAKPDKAGTFLWSALSDLWTYSANRIPEISDSIVEIDRAMRMGFNWETGSVRALGCGGRGSDRRAHEEGRPSGRGQCRKTARFRQEVLVRRRCRKLGSGRLYFDLASANLESRELFPPACGRWKSPRNRTAW